MSKYEQLCEALTRDQYTWLITGAAGFIGSNLVEKLLLLNQKVVGLDNFETGHQKNLDLAVHDASQQRGLDVSHLFHFIEGDITDLSDCEKSLIWKVGNDSSKVNFVLHQAALGSVPRSIEDPIKTNSTNIDGFLNMLQASRNAEVEKFVYAASSSTYGDHPALPKEEDVIGKPLSPYAVTKYVNELYADVYFQRYGVSTAGLRYFNVFGKRQDPKGAYAAVMPKWISEMIKNEDVTINGDGLTSRDFCHIDNAIQANLLAALSDSEGASVFNVAVGERNDLNTLFDFLKRELDKRGYSYDKTPVYQDFREGDVRHSLASIEKISTNIGYKPTMTLEEGLMDTIDYYIEVCDE